MARTKEPSREPNAAFMRPVQPDAVLSAVVGSSPLPRTELTKKLWAYIQKRGLQDKKVRTQINADDALKAVFGGKAKVSIYEMSRLVAKHMKNVAEEDGGAAAKSIGKSKPDSRRRREHLLDALKREHILEGIELFKAGHPHDFRDSTKFDLQHEGSAYPPKAIVGLAGVPIYGEAFKPDDFSGGADSKCFRVLLRNGFQLAPKPSEFPPTADEELLDARTRDAMAAPHIPKPSGQHAPKQIERTAFVYERDPLVRAFVLKRAAGRCECCEKDAPFVDRHGYPFLEVHHIEPMTEGGDDVVENAAAVCPNCHRECHHGSNAQVLRRRLSEQAKAFLEMEGSRGPASPPHRASPVP